jgi:hypothetical protein
MTTVLILNGPPNCGKDTVADRIELQYGWRHRRFKDRLYEIASFRSGCAGLRKYVRLCTDRDLKDKPYDGFTGDFKGLSPRESLIVVSENIVKPCEGADYFGSFLAKSIDSDYTVVSDGGFEEEIAPLINLGMDVYIAQLSRHNCSFDGDSRNYVQPEGAKVRQFSNDSSIADIIEDIMNWIGEE